MKIGLYLPYTPSLQFQQAKEGLGRYWIMLAKAMIGRGNKLVIACPPWMEKSIKQALEESHIDAQSDSIEYVIPNRSVAIWQLWELFYKYTTRKKKPKKKNSILNIVIEQLSSILFQIRSILLFFLFCIIIAAITVALSPFALVFALLLVLWKAIKGILKSDIVTRRGMDALLDKISSKFGSLTMVIQAIFIKILSAKTMDKIRVDMAEHIREEIGKMHNPASLWFCPMAFWPDVNDLPGVKVICFPDLVTSIFAHGFSDKGAAWITNDVHRTVRNADYFITYSEYQKNAIMVNKYGKNPDNIRAIDLFVNDTRLDIEISPSHFSTKKKSFQGKKARDVLRTLYENAPDEQRNYLAGKNNAFDFESTQYIFYASQIRPSKNIINLIRAYKYLLSTKEIDFKLVLTGSLAYNLDVYDFVHKENLQYDVLSFSMVSNQQLSALYQCALLSVTPTLFEGGFPMTFCEGLSVGTPSIFSNIPQVADRLTGYDLDDCLFDPFDYLSIANKIMYGVSNRKSILERQLPIYKEMVQINNEEIGKRYEDAFAYFIKKDKLLNTSAHYERSV